MNEEVHVPETKIRISENRPSTFLSSCDLLVNDQRGPKVVH